MTVRIVQTDCHEALRALPDDSVDRIDTYLGLGYVEVPDHDLSH